MYSFYEYVNTHVVNTHNQKNGLFAAIYSSIIINSKAGVFAKFS